MNKKKKHLFLIAILFWPLCVFSKPDNEPPKIKRIIEKAKNGDADAAEKLSEYYGYPSEHYNSKAAKFWIKESARLGNINAQLIANKIDEQSAYVSKTDFVCGGSKITVATFCASVSVPQGYALCHLQQIHFESLDSDYLFFNKNYLRNLTNIYQVKCAESSNKKQAWAVFSSGSPIAANNCPNCERDDFFTSEGHYLGSSQTSKYNQLIVSAGYKKINSLSANEINKVISNTRLETTQINIYPIKK